MKRKKFLIRLSITVFVCAFCLILLCWPNPIEYSEEPELRLVLAYVDKEDAIAVYVFEIVLAFYPGGYMSYTSNYYDQPEGIHIEKCVAYVAKEEHILQYTLIDVYDETTISGGDVLIIHNFTQYSGWLLEVYVSGKLAGEDIRTVYPIPPWIPDVSNQSAERTQSSVDILKVDNQIVEERKVFGRVEDYGKE